MVSGRLLLGGQAFLPSGLFTAIVLGCGLDAPCQESTPAASSNA